MTIRKAYIDTNAGQVHYRHSPGSGTPVLFFHRTPVSSASFERVFGELENTRPLYAFDTPGFGESFTPPKGSTIANYRDWFIEAIDALGITKFHLCGHHTGSHFAIEIAAETPSRVRSLMIDGIMYLGDAERMEAISMRKPAPPIDEAGDYIRIGWDFLKKYYPSFVPEAVHTEFVGAMRTLFTRDVCVEAVYQQNVPAQLSHVTCPVHVMMAADDVFVGHLPKIVGDLPAVTTSVYGKAGIAGPELQSKAFAKIVNGFIEKVELGN